MPATTRSTAPATTTCCPGSAGDDNLNGGAGDDKLYGGAGQNDMAGGTGNDWYIVDSLTDVIIEAAGEGTLDRVFTTLNYTLTAGAHVEILSTTTIFTGAINLTGNELANTIYGNGNTNVLGGAGGNDVLVGFGGTDTLNGGDGDDRLIGGTEQRHRERRQRQRPPAWRSRRRQRSTAAPAIDRLQGGAGQNDLAGGADDDIYIVTSTTDTIVETRGARHARPRLHQRRALRSRPARRSNSWRPSNVAGTGAMDLTGNAFANTIYGNNGANVISGKDGKDIAERPRRRRHLCVRHRAQHCDQLRHRHRLQRRAGQYPAGEVGLRRAHRQCRHDALRRPVRGRHRCARCQRPHHLQQRHAQATTATAMPPAASKLIAFLAGSPTLSNTDILLG